MPRLRIAAVLTVHNRAAMTAACLASLAAQGDGLDADITPYVMDDGSTDGTAERVREVAPTAVLLHGDGTFYWNGGMRVAFARARHDDPDYFLWLNDDTTLGPGAVATLVDTAAARGGPGAPVIACGAVTDPADGALSYSGVVQDRWRPARFHQVAPGAQPLEVDTMNGNVVLLSREVVRRVGNLSPAYRHAMGDYDYGLRARRAGAVVVLAPRVLGSCAANPGFVVGGSPLRDEFARLRSTKHLPPGEWAHFTRRWAGPAWPVVWASPYLRRMAAAARQRWAGVRRSAELSAGAGDDRQD